MLVFSSAHRVLYMPIASTDPPIPSPPIPRLLPPFPLSIVRRINIVGCCCCCRRSLCRHFTARTRRYISKKITNLTPLEKMDLPNCPTCHPSTNGLGRTPRTFRKKFPNLTPLVKMDSPYCHYFPTCHPSAIMDSATLVGDALSQCNDN